MTEPRRIIIASPAAPRPLPFDSAELDRAAVALRTTGRGAIFLRSPLHDTEFALILHELGHKTGLVILGQVNGHMLALAVRT